MERWIGKVAVITGASSGIGSAIVLDLVKSGMIVVGLARRAERVDELKKLIPANAQGELYAVKCDISNDHDVKTAFEWIEKKFGTVNVLVNNAGISTLSAIIDEGNDDELKRVILTNLWGLVSASKKFISIVRKQNVVGAHLININSILGHDVVQTPIGRKPVLNVYPGSKFGVTAVSEVLRQEFSYLGLKTKITSISPGLVTTEMTTKNGADKMFKNTPSLKAEDISQAVLYALSTPEHVQVHEITIRPFDNGKFDMKSKVRSTL
ncbi:Farnesol dehydrogenase [Pseudolycoriella hygida]|uniref:Farnesol dehydrogenase n=1 Tax=Pseudolycoriella hygida TaxID=35572 RepID=A0A9Q0NH12_9DIPT|nr:Farnesol dehydrogenase [Pseudolycoriella hygida]